MYNVLRMKKINCIFGIFASVSWYIFFSVWTIFKCVNFIVNAMWWIITFQMFDSIKWTTKVFPFKRSVRSFQLCVQNETIIFFLITHWVFTNRWEAKENAQFDQLTCTLSWMVKDKCWLPSTFDGNKSKWNLVKDFPSLGLTFNEKHSSLKRLLSLIYWCHECSKLNFS